MLAPIPEGTSRGIIFFGTPEVSARCLDLLISSGVHVDLVVTGEPKRRGRGSALMQTPVHDRALQAKIRVVHDLEAVGSMLEERRGEWLGIVVAYGRLIPRKLLSRLPLVNLHFSLLPRWRGAAPVERAILAGDDETGVCVMRIEEGLDQGAIYSKQVLPIRPGESAESLRNRLCDAGTTELVRLLEAGFPDPVTQSGDATYAHKIIKDERRIVWSDTVDTVSRVVRIGGAFSTFQGERLIVVSARPWSTPSTIEDGSIGEIRMVEREVMVACGEGFLVLENVQPAGKNPMSATSWWNGNPSTLASSEGAVRFD